MRRGRREEGDPDSLPAHPLTPPSRNPNVRVFRQHMHRGFGPQAGHGPQQQQQQQRTANPFGSLLQVLPFLLLFFFTFFSGSSDPPYALERTSAHVDQRVTARLNAPYFVKRGGGDFDRKFPPDTMLAAQQDTRIEQEYLEMVRAYWAESRDEGRGENAAACAAHRMHGIRVSPFPHASS